MKRFTNGYITVEVRNGHSPKRLSPREALKVARGAGPTPSLYQISGLIPPERGEDEKAWETRVRCAQRTIWLLQCLVEMGRAAKTILAPWMPVPDPAPDPAYNRALAPTRTHSCYETGQETAEGRHNLRAAMRRAERVEAVVSDWRPTNRQDTRRPAPWGKNPRGGKHGHLIGGRAGGRFHLDSRPDHMAERAAVKAALARGDSPDAWLTGLVHRD